MRKIEVERLSFLGRVTSLPNFNVIGGEETVRPSANATPPALIDHLNVGDDVIGVKGDLIFPS